MPHLLVGHVTYSAGAEPPQELHHLYLFRLVCVKYGPDL